MDSQQAQELISTVKVLQESILALNIRIQQLESVLARQNEVLNIVPLQNVVTGVGGD
jgi:hypothetical protein